MTRFFLGTHKPDWLSRSPVSLMVSRRRLVERKYLPIAKAEWVLDSGAFSELRINGRFTVSASQYAREAERFKDECGSLLWAAPQDWMCEPFMLSRTGLSIRDHQLLTVDNFRELQDINPEIPWIPVLQGWEASDYLKCADMYARAGVDLSAYYVAGVGSVCRRQRTDEIRTIITTIQSETGLEYLHGFGVKQTGLSLLGGALESCDSMAWSMHARYQKIRLPYHTHDNCANCIEYALQWRRELIANQRSHLHTNQ